MAGFQLLSTTNGDLVAVRAASNAAVSQPIRTDTVISTAAAGVIDRVSFGLRPSKPLTAGRLFIIGSFNWEVTVGGAAGSTGRINLTLRRNGADIPGVTAVNGATQAIDGVGGPFRETLAFVVPHGVRFDADDVVEIVAELEVVNAGGAGNATIRLHHNPAVGADEFVVEMPPLGEASVEHQGIAEGADNSLVVIPTASPVDVSSGLFSDTIVVTDGPASTVVNRLDFECRPTQPLRDVRLDILALVRWEVTAGGGAGATGRINLTANLNGAAIAGVVAANGGTEALDGIGGAFPEVLHTVIPELDLDLDDVLQIGIEIERVAQGAAGNATVRVHHNPNNAGDELFIEAVSLN